MGGKIRLVQRVDYLKRASKSREVLHLGCTSYPYTEDYIAKGMLLHTDLAALASRLFGFDFDQRGLDILRKAGTRDLFKADLEKLEEVDLERKFDVIIAGEMIEHLNNPGLFLKGIRRFMHDETDLIITTVNAYCGMRFFSYALSGRGGANEPVHPDHVAYYSFKTLKLLAERSGLRTKEFCFYDLGKEHRPSNPWYLNLVNDVSVRFSPHLSDGIIFRCRLE